MLDIQSRLREDHQRLDRMWQIFVTVAASADEKGKQDALAEFESTMVAHFEGEEQFLFPILAATFPEEIVALREEHEAMRHALAALVDPERIGAVDSRCANQLVATLRRHASREDQMLYHLTNESASGERYQLLQAFLERTYRHLRADDPEE